MKALKTLLVQPKNLVLLFITIAVIAASSVVIELHQSKSEMLELMEKQGHTLLETLLVASENALLSYNTIEEELETRLLNNASMVKMLYEKKSLSNSLLQKIADENNIYRINIFNSKGEKIYTSHVEVHDTALEKESPLKYLQPIFDGTMDTLIIGIKPSRFFEEYRFTVAISTKDRKAIVLNVNAKDMLNFRERVGFGILLKNVIKNKQIVYAALQDDDGIIAGSGNLQGLESIDSSEVIVNALYENSYKWRIAKKGSTEVFEALHPFVYNGEIIGIFRLGISLEPLNNINAKITQRSLIMGLILLVFGFVTIAFIFVKQNFNVLSKKFKVFESYSTRIIDNVSDGIIVVNSTGNIYSVNKAAEKLLDITENEIKDSGFSEIFGDDACQSLLNSEALFDEINCTINGNSKIFLVSRSFFDDENSEKKQILVLKDITKQKLLESHIARNERLAAMGELASSVAHEIRNPLNSIGTIAQQLGKDFTPAVNNEEYKGLTHLIYKEVRRINDSITNFLKFAKPQPVKAETFPFHDFCDQIKMQYQSTLKERNIILNIKIEYSGDVTWDRSQMTQVFINLFENSIEAIRENGVIEISAKEIDEKNLVIILKDNGEGISPENIKKIFNLYFTTKTKGNGIGLSIVQKIISEHGGLISVQSLPGHGTTFTINLPKNYS